MKANDEKVGKFLGGRDSVFIIPPFQRNYSWDEEQCSELFDDILNSIEKHKPHYIGNIVYYVGENNRAGFNEFILVDGQQRITSILLLLCALRSRLSADEAKRLEKNYLINEDEKDEKYRVRLKQTDSDLRVFEERFLRPTGCFRVAAETAPQPYTSKERSLADRSVCFRK